jgi:hypothetical protein
MYKFAFLLNNASPKAYRILREVLPFPSVTAIRTFWLTTIADTRCRIEGDLEDCNVPELLNEYRAYCDIPSDAVIPCTLGFGATSVTETGIVTNKMYQNSFSFLVCPLSHDRPDLLVHSMPHATGRIDAEVLATKDELIGILCENGYRPVFVATAG